jgi:integrase
MLTEPLKRLISSNVSVQNLHLRMISRESKSVETLRRYLEGVLSFSRFMDAKSPDEALEKLRASADITDVLDRYVDWLLKRGFSAVNLKAHWYGVKKWLLANRVNGVDWEFVSRPKVVSMVPDRIPSREELHVILDNKVSLRDKAFFLVAASSGLRIGTLATLHVYDYQPVEELGMITVEGGYKRKLPTGRRYFTFITPEARRFLEQYLQTRGNLKPEEPLFTKFDGKPLPENTSNISRQWRKLLQRAKLARKIPGHNFVELHAHVLRKFFQTNCKLAGCRADFVDFWMGHRSMRTETYLNDSYFRPSLQEHIKEYRKAVRHLTVFSDTLDLGLTEEDLETLREVLRLIKKGKIKVEF